MRYKVWSRTPRLFDKLETAIAHANLYAARTGKFVAVTEAKDADKRAELERRKAESDYVSACERARQ